MITTNEMYLRFDRVKIFWRQQSFLSTMWSNQRQISKLNKMKSQSLEKLWNILK